MQIRPPVVTPTSPTLPSPLRNSFDALGNNGLSLSLSHSLRPYPSRSMNRRASITGELFGSFIGSYEESILSGRMSTLPSRPIEFIAQIGVLGRGNCRSSLKCPPHINLPFPATFYNMQDDDAPTPYVGNIDLEHASADVLKQKKSTATRHGVVGYRIPTAGQLQVVIKNPNKTAIKLFLVPYDFSDMPIGTKTFIRQKSYAQPASDATTTTTTNSQSNNGNNRPVLRYAIQLQVCSPSRGRIYLYKHIRVVFSHRVPDGSEKLQVVCDGPGEPRYSPLTAACLSSNTGNSSINNGQNGSFRNTTKHLTNLLNVTTTTKGMQGRARAVSDVAHTVVVSRNEFKAQLDLCEQKKPPLMECTNTDRSTTMLTSSTTSALTLPLPFPSSSSSSSLRTSTSHKSVANHSHVPLSSQPPSPHPSIPILCFPSNHSEKPPHLPS
ncbi:hypothetical protein BDF19DRAFT_414805 [Syncephalis fuscata]|nr:hypothetical protein BDF19DRAFT_414805 [Syncephalis fuscata]